MSDEAKVKRNTARGIVSIYEKTGATLPRLMMEGLTGAELAQKNHIGAESLRAASGGALAVEIWNGDSLEEQRSPKREYSAVEQVGVGLLGAAGARTAGWSHLACQGLGAASGGRAV